MRKKSIIIYAVVLLLAFGLLFKNNLIRSFVFLNNKSLESYAAKMLEINENTSGKYGIWKTKSYPIDGMVEFYTGGFGLTPNSVYKGFYYSAEDQHKPFSAAYEDAVSMEIDGNQATWTDGTDNSGISIRITAKWFWFEASF